MNFNFLKYYKLLFFVSSIICAVILVLIFTKGFRYGTDFTGGIEMTVSFSEELAVVDIKERLTAQGLNPDIEKIISQDNTYRIRHLLLDPDAGVTEDLFNEILKKSFPEGYNLEQIHIVGGVLSSQNKSNALIISFIVILLIIGYLSMRFNLSYSLAAIVAVIHDVIIMLGVIIIFDFEMQILEIVAVLTIFGYSVNDSIILFDRIREKHKSAPSHIVTYKDLLNYSINNVFTRTTITTITTLIVVISLFLSTEGDYKEFALMLIIGMLSGTYSSIYIACSFLNFWNRKKPLLD